MSAPQMSFPELRLSADRTSLTLPQHPLVKLWLARNNGIAGTIKVRDFDWYERNGEIPPTEDDYRDVMEARERSWYGIRVGCTEPTTKQAEAEASAISSLTSSVLDASYNVYQIQRSKLEKWGYPAELIERVAPTPLPPVPAIHFYNDCGGHFMKLSNGWGGFKEFCDRCHWTSTGSYEQDYLPYLDKARPIMVNSNPKEDYYENEEAKEYAERHCYDAGYRRKCMQVANK